MNKNFAVHLPALDWMFGTIYLPGDRWPSCYGLSDGESVPPGHVGQFLRPFAETVAAQTRSQASLRLNGNDGDHAVENEARVQRIK